MPRPHPRGRSRTRRPWARFKRSPFTPLVLLLGLGAPTNLAGQQAENGGDEDLPLQADRTLGIDMTVGSWISLDVSPDGQTIVDGIDQFCGLPGNFPPYTMIVTFSFGTAPTQTSMGLEIREAESISASSVPYNGTGVNPAGTMTNNSGPELGVAWSNSVDCTAATSSKPAVHRWPPANRTSPPRQKERSTCSWPERRLKSTHSITNQN